MKVTVYVSVFSQKKTVGGMYEEVDEGAYTRELDLAAVPKDGDLLEYDDCGRRTELGKVRRVVHVGQPHPSPFREPDEPRVEVITRLFVEEPETVTNRLKGLQFHELER